MLSFEARYGAFGKQMEVAYGPVEKQILWMPSVENSGCTEMRRELNKEKIDYRRAGLIGSLPHNVTSRNSNMPAKSDYRTNIFTNIAAKLDHRTITATNMTDKPDPIRNAAANMVGKPDPRVDTAEDMASKPDLRINRTTDASIDMDTEPDIRTQELKKMNSRVAVHSGQMNSC